MKKIVFIVALENELPQKELPRFKIEYSGVGKINATYKTLEVIKNDCPDWISYGILASIAGSFGLKGIAKIKK